MYGKLHGYLLDELLQHASYVPFEVRNGAVSLSTCLQQHIDVVLGKHHSHLHLENSGHFQRCVGLGIIFFTDCMEGVGCDMKWDNSDHTSLDLNSVKYTMPVRLQPPTLSASCCPAQLLLLPRCPLIREATHDPIQEPIIQRMLHSRIHSPCIIAVLRKHIVQTDPIKSAKISLNSSAESKPIPSKAPRSL